MKITTKLKKTLSTRFFRVSFIKKDGSFREICGRQVPDVHKKHTHWLIWDNVDRCLKTIIKKNTLMIKAGKNVFMK